MGAFVWRRYDRRVTLNGPLTPDQQLEVLSVIWQKDEPGWVFLPWIPGTARTSDERKRNWKESRAFHWPDDREAVRQHLKSRDGDELYFTPNTFLGEMRKADLTGEETCLYADLDESDPEMLEDSLRPSIAWESSPGRYQAVWLLVGTEIGASERGGLNHRMTIEVGADPSGWDSTQLLRVPGRPNHKPDYKAANGGKAVPGSLMWLEANHKYLPTQLDQLLPVIASDEEMEDVEEAELESIDRAAVWGRVRLKVSSRVREFMAMRARDIDGGDFDRSDVLWQIERDLADAGCTVAEIIAVIRPTGWNKYTGRQNELTQLRHEAVKAKSESIRNDDTEDDTLEAQADAATRPSTPLWASDLLLKSIPRPNWLIRNIWTKGSCGFISGQPKSYKSWFALDMAVSVATGQPFLGDAQFSAQQGNVLYLQEEDNLPIVAHRLSSIVEARASNRFWHGQLTIPNKSHTSDVVDAHRRSQTLVWTPPTPLDTLALHVRKGFVASDPAWQSWLADFVQEHKFALVVIDTLGTTVGDTDTDKSGQLNDRVLKPLKVISEVTGCAIAIVHHNRKSSTDGTRSGQQMLGSVALHAWVESALYVQSKEKLTGQAAQVKVERESKLAEDLKLRVKIPTMYQAKGSDESCDRQLWRPEVLIGWAESDAEENKAQREINSTPDKSFKGPGAKIATWIKRQPKPKSKLWLLEELVNGYNQSTGHTLRQLNDAVKSGFLEGNETDGWGLV